MFAGWMATCNRCCWMLLLVIWLLLLLDLRSAQPGINMFAEEVLAISVVRVEPWQTTATVTSRAKSSNSHG